MYFKLLVLGLVLVDISQPAYAYLDPGTGSVLFTGLLGIMATVFFVVKGLIYWISESFLKMINIDINKDSNHDIVFYSEGARYWNVFLPIIKEMNRREIKCTYLTSEENDPGLKANLAHIDTKYIGMGHKAFHMLNNLKAEICVMTTPGIDVLQIRRSKGVKHYCHLTHSSGGVSGYRVFGLDYYDSVLTGGDGDKATIREIESCRNILRKEIIPIGCTYLDVLRSDVSSNNTSNPFFNNDKPTILISPTWGSHGLLNKYGLDILNTLVSENTYNVIIRPHPQSVISEKNQLDELEKKFPQGDYLIWDYSVNPLDSMIQADVMVSDFSGIVFDFLFLFAKPILTFVGQYDKKGKDSSDLTGDPWNLKAIKEIGIVLDENKISELPKFVNEAISNKGSMEKVLDTARNDMDKYPNESGRRGCEALMQLKSSL